MEIQKTSVTPPIPFGSRFTDHMFSMEWNQEAGWHNHSIEQFKNFSLSPASVHMHYSQEIFEGMKAFKTEDNKPIIFRAKDHLARFNRSAKIMCMPSIDEEEILQWLCQLVARDHHWIPQEPGTALYIRPTMIATEPTLQVRPSNSYLFYIILSPVGALYQNGFNPVSIWVSTRATRTPRGGVGQAKTGGNYAAALHVQEEAKQNGCSQVLWLDPIKMLYAEEVGAMNIFFVIDTVLVTPALSGTILSGITRRSIIELAPHYGLTVKERLISITEIQDMHAQGRLKECFGSGTAAVISPVGELRWDTMSLIINNKKTGPIAQLLFDTLTGIQQQKIRSFSHWLYPVNKQRAQ